MSQNNIEDKDDTNWGAWYAALVIVLVLQIVIYFAITNKFAI